MKDIISAFRFYNMWFLLGWYDIKHRYRRSLIGPLWITISTGVMVGGIGLIFSTIFKSPVSEFLPYFAVGQILWTFVSTQLTEACTVFMQYQGIIKQISIPLPVYILRKLWQNIILLGHNLIIIFFVISFIGHGWSWSALYVIPAFILILILLFSVSLILSIACARFMDIAQVVSVFLQLVYFITPVFWMKRLLPEKYVWITELNPFYHAIEIIRAPLLGAKYPTNSMLWLIFYACVFTLIAVWFLKRFKQRVPYWV